MMMNQTTSIQFEYILMKFSVCDLVRVCDRAVSVRVSWPLQLCAFPD